MPDTAMNSGSPTEQDGAPRLRTLLLILAGFALIQSLIFAFHSFPHVNEESDGIGYMSRAQGLLMRPHSFHGPGYSLAIRAVALTGMGLFPAAKIASILSGILFLTATWFILSSFASTRETALATALSAFGFVVLVLSNTVMSDMMASALFLAVLALGVVPERTATWRWLVTGALAGLVYLTRSVYLPVLLALPIVVWIVRRETRPAWRKAFDTLVFYLLLLLVALPWLLVLKRERGTPFHTLYHLSIAFKMYRETRGWNAFPAPETFPTILDVIRSDPWLFFTSWFQTAVWVPFRSLWTLAPVGLLALPGVFLRFRSPWRRKLSLLVPLALYDLVASFAWVEDRFLVPFVPLVAWLSAATLLALPVSIRLRRGGPAIALRAWAVALCFALTAAYAGAGLYRRFHNPAIEYRAAAQWIAENEGKGLPAAAGSFSVMASKPHVPFFAGARYIDFRYPRRLQDAKLADLPGFLADLRPKYFVFDERYAGRNFPQYAALFDPATNPFPDILAPEFQTTQPPRIVVYRYVGPRPVSATEKR